MDDEQRIGSFRWATPSPRWSHELRWFYVIAVIFCTLMLAGVAWAVDHWDSICPHGWEKVGCAPPPD